MTRCVDLPNMTEMSECYVVGFVQVQCAQLGINDVFSWVLGGGGEKRQLRVCKPYAELARSLCFSLTRPTV